MRLIYNLKSKTWLSQLSCQKLLKFKFDLCGSGKYFEPNIELCIFSPELFSSQALSRKILCSDFSKILLKHFIKVDFRFKTDIQKQKLHTNIRRLCLAQDFVKISEPFKQIQISEIFGSINCLYFCRIYIDYEMGKSLANLR